MNRWTIAVLLGTSLAVFGCSKEEHPAKTDVTAADVRQQAKEAAGTAAQYVAQEKEEFVRASQQQLDRLKDQLASLNSQALAASGEAKIKLGAQIGKLDAQLKAVEAKLAALQAAGTEQWQEAKASFTTEMQELKQSFEENEKQRKQG